MQFLLLNREGANVLPKNVNILKITEVRVCWRDGGRQNCVTD